MKSTAIVFIGAAILSSPVLAQTAALNALPAQSMTVTQWNKQNVYDADNNKIGDINDVLLDGEGKVTALIIGVGGFLGMGEKDIAVPFSAVKRETKDGKVYLTMASTKDALKSAPGFKYDSKTLTWTAESK